MIPDLTIVIATRNRRSELLRSLAHHDAPVIVMDNGSTDGAADAVRAAYPDAAVVELDHNCGAYARTLGTHLAQTPYVAFADDDSWWAPGALQRGVEIMNQYPRLAVLAAQLRILPANALDPTCHVMANSQLGRVPHLPGPALLGFIACAAIVRRGAFLSVGGFDHVIVFPGEEERVALDLASAGLGISYVSDVVAFHQPSPYREPPRARQIGVRRSRLLTTLMRRSWTVVGRETAAAFGAGRPGWSALISALPRLPGALSHRAPISAALEGQVALLDGRAAPGTGP